MKTAVIDVGGGLRDIYGAGVLDRCIDEHIHFDVCIGVSAGAANTASYIAGQKGRNYKFFTDYMLRKECMSTALLLKKGIYLDVEYIYETLSVDGGEYPLDYDALINSEKEYYVIATNAITGHARYFTKKDLTKEHYEILSASSAIPIVCKPEIVQGIPYYDGALSDCVPIEKALTMDCDRIVLILSKPVDQKRSASKDIALSRILRHMYPNAAKGLANRAPTYNKQVERALRLQEEGKLLVVSPETTDGVDTLSKDKAKLDALYQRGYRDAQIIQSFLQD